MESLIPSSEASILDHIPEGRIFDPWPQREKFSRARCDRCGCWISERTAIARDGWLYCGVCDHSRASPAVQ